MIPDRKLGSWIVPTYHPNYIRKDKTTAAHLFFKHDIEKAVWCLERPLPDFVDESKNVRILDDVYDIQKYLETLLKMDSALIAIDYETTGLKPHLKEHKLVSVSITHKPGHATAFLLKNRVRKRLCEVLKSPKIKKIAANMKFEEAWSVVKLGTPVNMWVWDTMIAEHLLDNRRGVTGLKHQVFVHYGVDDYDSHLGDHLQSNDDLLGANGLNNIHKIDTNDLLIYNGLDTIYEYERAMDQMKRFGILDPVNYAKKFRGCHGTC